MDTIICTTKQTPKNVKFSHYYVCDIFIWSFTNYASWSKNTYINLWKTVIMNGKITWFMIHRLKNAINCNFMHIFERLYIYRLMISNISKIPYLWSYKLFQCHSIERFYDSLKKNWQYSIRKNKTRSGYYIKLTLHCSVNDIYILF